MKEEQWLLEEKYQGVASLEFEKDKARLAAGEPLAYVIGSIPFLGLTVHLDSKPLIPRPETEWWVEKMLEQIAAGSAGRACSFLDLCAGSGAIGCTVLNSLPHMIVSFGEIDPAHETTIRKNIRENKLDASRATIGIGDLFAPFQNQTFDFIASNPPYIPEKRALPKSVADFEPAQALFGGADGLAIIRRIAAELPHRLNPGGTAWIECDSEHVQAARDLFVAQGCTAEMRSDQYGISRFLVLSY